VIEHFVAAVNISRQHPRLNTFSNVE